MKFIKYDLKPNTISNGTLYTYEVYIDGIGEDKKRLIRVYLPSNYDKEDGFPVIYMMDGKNLFDQHTSFMGEWCFDEVIEDRIVNSKQSVIVVGIDSATSGVGRIEDMLPDNKYLTSVDDLPDNLNAYGKILGEFIVKNIKPLIDKNFKTSEYCAIGGSSMGGLFAFYMAMKYKEVFNMSFCFSPAFCLYEDDFYKEKLNCVKSFENKMYLLVGNIEYENQFVSLTEYTSDYLKAFCLDNIKYVHDLTGIHHESFWNKYINDALDFWLENKKITNK